MLATTTGVVERGDSIRVLFDYLYLLLEHDYLFQLLLSDSLEVQDHIIAMCAPKYTV